MPKVIPPPAEAALQVPAGFTVNVFADDLQNPRWLALTPDGEVLVTETRLNRIRLLRDQNHDGLAEAKLEFATEANGLYQPFGMAFDAAHFYLGNTDAVMRFPFHEGQTKLEGQGEKIVSLPGGGYNQHWTRNVRLSPNRQQLFITVGSKENVGEESLPRASVERCNLDGSALASFATGLRNPVGLDFEPHTGDVYVTVNERDLLGDDLVPDYFTRIEAGDFFGWPYAYLSPTLLDPRMMEEGRSKKPELTARTKTPDVLIQAHSACLGLAFYTGKQFPGKYRNGAFAACRGSWNRSTATGYKIIFIPFGEDHRPKGYYEDFVTGFLLDPEKAEVWGRPVAVLVAPDGSLLFTEEENQRVYRVTYAGGR
jgi:glucose/arabinose dehydrogenase